MKKYKLLVILAAMVLSFTACKTDVDDPAGPRNIGVVPSITNLNPAAFDVNDPENTFVKFDLDAESAVNEIVIYASFNGDLRRTRLKSYTTFPAKGEIIYMRDVAAALGLSLNDIKPGNTFNLELVTVQGSSTYRSNAVINAAAVCAYDSEMVSGAYKAVSPDWPADGPVTITIDPTDEYIVYVAGLAALDGLDEDKGPLKMVVNPLNFEVKAERTVLASAAFGYTNIAYEGFGLLNTCDGTYDMNFTITVDQGSFGQYSFSLIKQ
ncbi:MAG: hypothetical protein RBR87_15340 [Bacteroidales bacterium]|jgi:hypothetical protein|nr:hypothetical protein [Bacteroidales bacterium]